MIDIYESQFIQLCGIPAYNADARVPQLIGMMSFAELDALLLSAGLVTHWTEMYDGDWTIKALDRYYLMKFTCPIRNYANICFLQHFYRCYFVDATKDQLFDRLLRVINLKAFL